MKKTIKHLSIILCIFMLISTFVVPVSAETKKSGDFEYEEIGSTITVTKYTGKSSNLKIPAKIKGKKVTAIGYKTFESNKNLKSVSIPTTLKTIESSAFRGCSSLKSITIPKNVEEVGPFAFYNCKSLSKITLKSKGTAIAKAAFKKTAYYEKKSNWENGYLYIGKYLIKADKNIKTVKIKSGTKVIADCSFRECENLKTVKIPASVRRLGAYSFYDCKNLEKISLDKNIKSIGQLAFGETSFYNNPSNWEDGALYIGDCLIKVRCYEMSSEIIEKDGQTHIDFDYKYIDQIKPDTRLLADYSFNEFKMDSITIPSSVKYIGAQAFIECDKLHSITIPSTVKSIGRGAFGYYYHEGEEAYRFEYNNCYESDKLSDFEINIEKTGAYKETAGYKYAKANNIKINLF